MKLRFEPSQFHVYGDWYLRHPHNRNNVDWFFIRDLRQTLARLGLK